MFIALAKNGHEIEVLTDAELKWVKDNIHLKNAELARRFGVPERRMRHLMRRHNLERYRVRYWEVSEIEFLKENYNLLTENEMAAKLGRTKKAIQKKKGKLGLKVSTDRRAEIGRAGQKKMGRPSTYRDEGEIWYLKSINKWMTKQNGKIIHWRRWAWEQLHGPAPPGRRIYWKNNDNSKADPAMLQLSTAAPNEQYTKDRDYVKSIIYRQEESSNYYIANGYSIAGCIFGSVWIDEGHSSSQRMKKRIEEINDRWPRHWQLKKNTN